MSTLCYEMCSFFICVDYRPENVFSIVYAYNIVQGLDPVSAAVMLVDRQVIDGMSLIINLPVDEKVDT